MPGSDCLNSWLQFGFVISGVVAVRLISLGQGQGFTLTQEGPPSSDGPAADGFSQDRQTMLTSKTLGNVDKIASLDLCVEYCVLEVLQNLSVARRPVNRRGEVLIPAKPWKFGKELVPVLFAEVKPEPFD